MKKIIEDAVGSDRTQDLRAVLGAKLRIATIAHLEKGGFVNLEARL
jgi:hypothetical protein